MRMDQINIEILEDGVISVSTDEISDTNHISADELLFMIQELAGGKRETKRKEHPFWRNRQVLRGGKIVQLRR